MRAWIILAATAVCEQSAGRPADPPQWPGVHVPEVSTSEASSTGDLPRLDLGAWPDLPTMESTSGEPTSGGSTSGSGEASTGSTSEASSGADASTAADTSSSTGDEPDPSTGEVGSSSSTGEASTGEAESPCPCDPDAAAAENFCGLAPGACEATEPGGYCDQNGDGDFADGDWVLGWQQWTAKCA